jgi:hypothetical protein
MSFVFSAVCFVIDEVGRIGDNAINKYSFPCHFAQPVKTIHFVNVIFLDHLSAALYCFFRSSSPPRITTTIDGNGAPHFASLKCKRPRTNRTSCRP